MSDTETSGTTFTQADVDRFVAEERRRNEEKINALTTERDNALRDVESQKALVATSDERIKEVEAEAAKHNLNATKFYVALETGLPLPLAERLQGDDEEALKSDAESLKSLIPSKTLSDEGLSGPKKAPEEEPDMNTLLRRAAGREA